MSLSSKIALILTAIIAVYAIVTDAVQRRIFLPRFELVERREAGEDIERIVKALAKEVLELDRVNQSWSAWDDAYDFMAPGADRAAFEHSNLIPAALGKQGIDLLYFCDSEGFVVFGVITDPDAPEGPGRITLRDFPRGQLYPQHPLLADPAERIQHPGGGGGTAPLHHHGVMLTEHAPLLISSRRIVRSDGSGEPRGTLITGRFLSRNLQQELSAQTSVSFDYWQADGRTPLDPGIQAVLDEVTASPGPVEREKDEHTLELYQTFNDFRGHPALLLRANVQRDISATGRTAVRFGFISTLVAGFVLLLVLMDLLARIVLKPISKLTEHSVRIGRTEDFRAKLHLDRSDELGTLSREFDAMMEKLETARAALVDTARAAGMSEIATGILHNVGNVLNSVNISASTVAQRLETMSLEELRRIDTILEDKKDVLPDFIRDDPKGKHLQPFIHALTTQLGQERDSILAEVSSLNDGIDHICELIKSQQSYAIKADLVEPLDLGEKMDEAFEITGTAIAVDPDIQVVREYEALPEVMLDRHRLAEVLVNLIQNARQAMEEAGTNPKRLTLCVAGHGDERVRLEVRDNGPGIEPENITRIFNLGFTTRKVGHGYGLHTAANAAVEMGGTLTARSDGAGHGATLVLELPLRVATALGEAI